MQPHSDTRRANLEAVRAAEAQGLGTYDAYPARVTLELTADCNLRCPHCEFTPPRAWKDKHDPKRILHVSIEDVRRFAEEVFPHIQEVVPSVVGEPMMYPHWDEFLALCAEYGVFVEMYTNGTYLDESTLPKLLPATAKIIISMDGASRATFNELRRPSDFDDILRRLRAVAQWRAQLRDEQRPSVKVHSVLTLHWVDELEEMVRLVKDHAIDGLSVGHLVAYNDHWERFHPSREPERTDRALRAAAAEAARLGVDVQLPRLFGSGEDVSHRAPPAFPLVAKVAELPRPPKPQRRYWCKYLWRELFITLGGVVSPCCGLRRPDVGSLHTARDLKSLFASPVLAAMREGMVSGELHPACAQCPQLSMYDDLDYARTDFKGTYATLEGELARQRAARAATPGGGA
jgi:MoaA/NifB/PqqE/SkfB family radical SAM enzyme